MQVRRIDSQVKVEFMSRIIQQRIGSNQPPPLEVTSISIPRGIDCIELRGVLSVIQIIRDQLLDEEEVVGMTDMVLNLVV